VDQQLELESPLERLLEPLLDFRHSYCIRLLVLSRKSCNPNHS